MKNSFLVLLAATPGAMPARETEIGSLRLNKGFGGRRWSCWKRKVDNETAGRESARRADRPRATLVSRRGNGKVRRLSLGERAAIWCEMDGAGRQGERKARSGARRDEFKSSHKPASQPARGG